MQIGSILAMLLLTIMSFSLVYSSDFEQFALKNKKAYQSSGEKAKRASIYAKRKKAVDTLNKRAKEKKRNLRFKLNKFSDLDPEEFRRNFTGFKKSADRILANTKKTKKPKNKKTKKTTTKKTTTTTSAATTISMGEVGDYFDWTNVTGKSFVGDVKDQGNCGSCWTFGAIAAVEGYYARKGNKLTLFSEQQVLSCNSPPNFGCNGGYHLEALKYLMSKGAMTSTDYKYTGKKGKCNYNAKKAVAGTKFSSVKQTKDEKEMLRILVQNGPMAVAIDSSLLQSYDTGIIQGEDCTTNLDHVVTLVGFGTENGEVYWNLKNSWGQDWGEKGFFRLSRNEDTCGISQEVFYIA